MAKIKICGLRREEDVKYINQAAPEYAGFVMSMCRRYVSPEEANRLARELLPQIIRVGVFASEKPAYIARAVSTFRVSVVQLHFDTNESFLAELMAAFAAEKIISIPSLWQRIKIPVNAVSDREIESLMQDYPKESHFSGFILDACKEQQDGGTGHVFPWEIAHSFLKKHEVIRQRAIIAGGLTADTVQSAIHFFDPMVVDVSSGVETNGMKDVNKVMEFFEQARKA